MRARRDGAGVPVPLMVPAALGVVFLVLPVVGLLVSTPWSELASGLAEPGVGQAVLRDAGFQEP